MRAALLALALLLAPARASGEAEQQVTRDTPHFTFAYRARYWTAIRDTLTVAESARAGLIADFGARAPAPRTEVRFARDVEEMRGLCPRRPPGYADAVAFWPENVLVISLTSSHHRPVSVETVFRHELAHLALRWAVGDARIPRWFNEGLAVFASNEMPMDRMQVLWPAAASGQVIPLDRLDRSFPLREFQVNLAYAQSADLVRYLVLHDGRWRLRELLGRVRAGEAFGEAMGATWNSTPGELEAAWQADMAQRYSVVPAVTAGMTLWVAVGSLAVVAYVRRRREIRRRIAAMPDEPFAGEEERG